MKRTSILLITACLITGGCADPMEQHSAEEVQGQFERGVTGQGTLGPIERPADDPASKHSVPQTHP
jgi:hypothetical protein